jgi:hypothetical protein
MPFHAIYINSHGHTIQQETTPQNIKSNLVLFLGAIFATGEEKPSLKSEDIVINRRKNADHRWPASSASKSGLKSVAAKEMDASLSTHACECRTR